MSEPVELNEWDAADETLERRIRTWAIPGALLAARLLFALPGGHFLGRTFLSMWIHELGHATAAWLCGFPAFPGPWLTPMAGSRSAAFALLVSAGLIVLAIRVPKLREVSFAALALQLFCTLALSSAQARQLIIFAGDGGCLVLGTALMLTLYSTGHLKQSWLRWGFLVIGAVAFMDAFEQWWASRTDVDRIPFGANEGVGLSDPSVLSDEFGWSAATLVRRYVATGITCLVVLAGVWGLQLRRRAPESNP